MNDCIFMSRFQLTDVVKGKRVVLTTNVMPIAGNIPQAIWRTPYLRERILRDLFTTPARYRSAVERAESGQMKPRGIELLKRLGDSQVDRGLTQWSSTLQPQVKDGSVNILTNKDAYTTTLT